MKTNWTRKWSLPALTGVLVLLAGCGGGGGGGGSDDGGGSSEPFPEPPTSAVTGLEDPSFVLDGTEAQAIDLVADLLKGYGFAHAAVALQQLGSGASDLAAPTCTSGTVTPTGSGPAYNYTYSGCVLGGFTFDGTVIAQPTDTGFRIDYDALKVSLGSTVLAEEASGATVCTVQDGQPTRCIAEFPFGLPEGRDNFRWGWDSTWTAGVVNGTHQCGCEATWNVTYIGFDGASGEAIILGSNGDTAYVKRENATDFTVRAKVGGVESGPFDIVDRN